MGAVPRKSDGRSVFNTEFKRTERIARVRVASRLRARRALNGRQMQATGETG
jgi:hypothetical protein